MRSSLTLLNGDTATLDAGDFGIALGALACKVYPNGDRATDGNRLLGALWAGHPHSAALIAALPSARASWY